MAASGRKKRSKPGVRGKSRRTSQARRRKGTRRGKKGARGRARLTVMFKRWRGSSYRKAAYRIAVLSLWTVIIFSTVLFYYALDLPSTDGLWQVDRQPTITVRDRRGAALTTRGLSYGLPVTISELPVYLPQAVIAIEDKRFYHHIGVDLVGVVRAAYTNWREGQIVPRRQHDHAAIGEESLSDARAHDQTQSSRSHVGFVAGAPL